MSNEAYVKYWCQGQVCTIEFFHPKSNALPTLLLQQLTRAFQQAATDNKSKLVVLRAGGDGAFCAGASFDELAAITTEAEGVAFFSGFANLVNAMRTCPKLIIGRIHGKAAGGGVGLAAACDYALATTAASIRLSELAIGIGPFVIGPVVELKTGLAAFSQLAIDANTWRSSEWALQKGLYATVHANATQLDSAIHQLTTSLEQSGMAAMAALKDMLWQGTGHWDKLLANRAAISGKLVTGTETKAAIAAFKAKK